MSVRKETKDLMRKSERMPVGYYFVSLDRLEGLGEAFLGSKSTKDAQVPMDVDPPAKRQRTGGACSLTLKAVENTQVLDILFTRSADYPITFSACTLTTTGAGGSLAGRHPAADTE
jgi:hypothetical protein